MTMYFTIDTLIYLQFVTCSISLACPCWIYWNEINEWMNEWIMVFYWISWLNMLFNSARIQNQKYAFLTTGTPTYWPNAMLRISYWSKQLKTVEIILIPKPGKDPMELTSYCPIGLVSTVNKIFQKFLLRRINMDLKPDDWMTPHQFGFRNQHSTVQQTHRIIHTIHQALEDKQYCTSVFFDVSQAFDKV
jgi:hypothetical protein